VRDLAASGPYQKLCPDYAIEQTGNQQKEKNETHQNKEASLQEVLIEPARDIFL
jgi:hypothetical protein